MATLTELQAELAELKAARSKARAGQSYRDVAGNSVTRGDLATLNADIERIEARIAFASNGGRLVHGVAVFRGTR